MMSNRATLGGGSLLDMVCPINWLNPINTGLVARWQCIPGLMGGSRLVNLSRLGDKDGNHGTLTNGPTWQGALGRPGGFGSLKFDGSDDEATLGKTGLDSLTGCSFQFWVRAPAAQTQYSRVLEKGVNNEVAFVWGEIATDKLTLLYRVGGFSPATSTSVLADDKWHHIVGTHDGSTARLYVDGLLDASAASVWASTGTGDLLLGRYGGGGFYGRFWLDGVSAFARCLSASEVYAVYEDDQRGNPQGLNWISTRTYFGVQAGSTFTASIATTIGAATASVSATFTKPTYAASIGATIGGVSAAASAQFTKPTYMASVAATIGGASAAALATFVKPTYTAVVSASVGAATASASATHTKPTYTGTIGANVAPATAAASAQFTKPSYTATINANAPRVTASASAQFYDSGTARTAAIAANVGAATMSVTGSRGTITAIIKFEHSFVRVQEKDAMFTRVREKSAQFEHVRVQ